MLEYEIVFMRHYRAWQCKSPFTADMMSGFKFHLHHPKTINKRHSFFPIPTRYKSNIMAYLEWWKEQHIYVYEQRRMLLVSRSSSRMIIYELKIVPWLERKRKKNKKIKQLYPQQSVRSHTWTRGFSMSINMPFKTTNFFGSPLSTL